MGMLKKKKNEDEKQVCFKRKNSTSRQNVPVTEQYEGKRNKRRQEFLVISFLPLLSDKNKENNK